MYSSLAMQNEERQYFGVYGEIKAKMPATAPQQKRRGGEQALGARMKER